MSKEAIEKLTQGMANTITNDLRISAGLHLELCKKIATEFEAMKAKLALLEKPKEPCQPCGGSGVVLPDGPFGEKNSMYATGHLAKPCPSCQSDLTAEVREYITTARYHECHRIPSVKQACSLLDRLLDENEMLKKKTG